MSPTLNQDRYLLDAIITQARATSRVLDFGAGGGQFAIALRQLLLDVTAVEPDMALHDTFIAGGVPVTNAIAALPTSSFDLVYSCNALHRVDDDAEALRQIHATLRPDGKLLLFVPAFMHLDRNSAASAGRLRRYTRSRLIRAVSGADFVIERARYVDCIGFFAALLRSLLARGNREDSAARRIYDRVIFPVSVWLDVLVGRWLGRGLLLVARKQ